MNHLWGEEKRKRWIKRRWFLVSKKINARCFQHFDCVWLCSPLSSSKNVFYEKEFMLNINPFFLRERILTFFVVQCYTQVCVWREIESTWVVTFSHPSLLIPTFSLGVLVVVVGALLKSAELCWLLLLLPHLLCKLIYIVVSIRVEQ